MTNERQVQLIRTVRASIAAVTWYTPRYFKPVHKALEHVIRVGNYAGMLIDPGVTNENGGPDAIQADVCRELDALERLVRDEVQ